METENTQSKILAILLKEPFGMHTATSLAEALNITRQGVWKNLKSLEKEKIITSNSVNKAKTSTSIIRLNWQNPVTEKILSLILTKEALNYERWRFDFAELKNHVKFLILYGSILHSPKEANDIDIIAVLDKNNFKAVEEEILNAQKTQLKKIHLIDMTEKEFKEELKRPNKAYLDAFKKGVVLYGQDNLIKFIGELQQ